MIISFIRWFGVPMIDAELRGWLLLHFYGLRDRNGGSVPVDDMIVSRIEHVGREAIRAVCEQLAGVDLIHWGPLTGANEGHIVGNAKITGLGADVVTGDRVSPIEIRFPNAAQPDLPATMPAIKEPERINLADGLRLLEEHLPAEEAKVRLRQAFVQKAFSQAPLFALPYDEAVIDWTTGLVKIPRKNDRFCPTFLRTDFASYFLRESMAAAVRPLWSASVAQTPQKLPELVTLKPTFMGMSIDLKELWRRFRSWWERRTERQK
jgi:hypothetical protein